MPGPCSRPKIGKSAFVRMTKNKGATPKNGYPKTLAARVAQFPKDGDPPGYHYNKPGSYKK